MFELIDNAVDDPAVREQMRQTVGDHGIDPDAVALHDAGTPEQQDNRPGPRRDLIQQLDDIPSAYQAAYGAARLRASIKAPGLVDLRQLSVLGLLLMADAPSVYLQRLADQLIAPIAAQDERRDAQLLTTLRAWLRTGSSVTQTAATLTVHVNTVAQRLTRVEKLTARDLKLANTRLELQLALHVWDILQSRPPS